MAASTTHASHTPPTVAWIGWGHFREGVEAAGWRVLPVPFANTDLLEWQHIVDRLGEIPDMVVYLDRSLPPPLLGLPTFPCFTVFHCVDSHIHSWYPAWAQAFDACSVSLKDHLPQFKGRLDDARLRWMPPGTHVPPAFPGLPEADKEYDLLFVGHVDPQTTPGRVAFLDALRQRLPNLTVTQGDFRTLYPKARLVLNIAERGDLNFRVFEALAWGGCLLTPRIGHGQAELFKEGEHLFTYPHDDADAVAALAQELLPDAERRQRVAQAGHLQVLHSHTNAVRGAAFVQWLDALPRRDIVQARLTHAASGQLDIVDRQLKAVYLHWAEELPHTPRGQRYAIEALRSQVE